MRRSRKPSIVLFLDDSWESREARKIFATNGFRFEVMPASGPGVPGVKVGGVYYSGLRRLDAIAEKLG